MKLEQLRQQIPEFAKDIKLNLLNILTLQGAPDLNQKQIFSIALACAYATANLSVISAIEDEAQAHLTDADIQGAKSAATIMAMNNVYYRFVHLVNDQSFRHLPTKLRMNVINNPGIDKVDFELSCLAVSAINGCGMCMDAHVQALRKSDISKLTLQSVVRIASVVNATALAVQT